MGLSCACRPAARLRVLLWQRCCTRYLALLVRRNGDRRQVEELMDLGGLAGRRTFMVLRYFQDHCFDGGFEAQPSLPPLAEKRPTGSLAAEAC